MNTNTNTSIKCVLCNGLCENEYGNNPFPLSETGVCCNVCNIKVVDERIMSSCFPDEDSLEYSDSEEEQCESCGACGCETAIADMYKSSIHLTEGICIDCRDEEEAEEEERQFLRNKEAQGLVQNALGRWVPKQDIYECNTCQEDFDRLNPIWIAMGIKDSNYCLPCELAHEQPIECEMCKGMFAPDDICDDRCVPCYENYQEWLAENDMDA